MKLTAMCTRVLLICALSIIFVPSGNTVSAATHIVMFGGNAGFKYVPATLSAAVGDTVKWVGDFSVHPISSTTIPSGAQGWHVASGSSFSYVITMQGTYRYKCDLHTGMTGDFQAGTSAIRHSSFDGHGAKDRIPISITGESSNPSVNFTALHTGWAVLQIIDLNGREKATLLNRAVSQGTFSIPLAGMRTDGLYYLRLNCNGAESGLMFNCLR